MDFLIIDPTNTKVLRSFKSHLKPVLLAVFIEHFVRGK